MAQGEKEEEEARQDSSPLCEPGQDTENPTPAYVRGDRGGPTRASKTQQRVKRHGGKLITTTANPMTAIRMRPRRVEDEGEGTQYPHFEFPDETTFRTPTTMYNDT